MAMSAQASDITPPPADHAAPSALHIRQTALKRGGRLLFEQLDFSLNAGEMVILRGANGCGKSSFMRALMGYLPFASGTITLDQIDVTADREFLWHNTSYLGHKNGLKPTLSLRENLQIYFGLTYGRAAADDHILAVTEQLNMPRLLDDPVQYFSSGQTRRAALCQLPLLMKSIWIMDEPTVGLDKQNRERLRDMMQNHLSKGGMILAATHEDLGLSGRYIELEDFLPHQEEQNLTHDPEGWTL